MSPGKYQHHNAKLHAKCEFCPISSLCSADSICEGCSPGKYQDQNNEANVICVVCESGKFANTSNASSCKDCPAGRNLVVVATNANYHDEEEDCQICASGKYSLSGSASCEFCRSGFAFTRSDTLTTDVPWKVSTS